MREQPPSCNWVEVDESIHKNDTRVRDGRVSAWVNGKTPIEDCCLCFGTGWKERNVLGGKANVACTCKSAWEFPKPPKEPEMQIEEEEGVTKFKSCIFGEIKNKLETILTQEKEEIKLPNGKTLQLASINATLDKIPTFDQVIRLFFYVAATKYKAAWRPVNVEEEKGTEFEVQRDGVVNVDGSVERDGSWVKATFKRLEEDENLIIYVVYEYNGKEEHIGKDKLKYKTRVQRAEERRRLAAVPASSRLAEVLLNGVARVVLIIISILFGGMSLLLLGILLWENVRAYKRKRRPTVYLLPRWKSEINLNR